MTGPFHEHGFRHEAFFYADADEFLEQAVPFVQAGVEGGEAVLVALPSANLKQLRGALGRECELVRFAEMEKLGRNPGRIISAWRDFVDGQVAAGRGARGIGEPIWAGRTPAEVDECVRHESLLNLAFRDDPPWSLVCPYNTAELDDQTLSSAERTHPIVSRPGGAAESGSYSGPMQDGGPFAGELDPPAPDAAQLAFASEQLGDMRHFVSERSRRAGLDAERTADLVLAANEAATNSIRHGGGDGTVLIWRDGDAVVCEVRDRGRIDHRDKPLIGRERPPVDHPGGRGLWIANQLCDLVQIRSGDWGNAVRVRMSS